MEYKLLSINELTEFLSVSRRTIYYLIKQKDFPKPVYIMNMQRFKSNEIESWLIRQPNVKTI